MADRKAMIVKHVRRLCPFALACTLAVSKAWAQEPTETEVHDLIKLVNDQDILVRRKAVLALRDLGPYAKPAVPALIEALEDTDLQVSLGAAWALARIGSDARPAVAALLEAMKDRDGRVRESATWALTRIAPGDKAAVLALIEALNDHYSPVREHAAEALVSIAVGLQEKKDTSALPELQKAVQALTSAGFPGTTVKPVRLAVEALRAIEQLERQRWYDKPLEWCQRYPWVSVIVLIELALLGLWVAFLWLHPATLLGINNALDRFFNEQMKIKIKGFEGSALPKVILLVGPFQYCRRVLDGWVKKHISTVEKNFARKTTVADRKTHVPIPVVLDGDGLPDVGPEQLGPTCAKSRWCVLIRGEGGAGKTSLACQMARWAMAAEKTKRLAKHRMLPVLIEQDLVSESSDGERPKPNEALHQAVHGQLRDLTAEPDIPQELTQQLLLKQRVIIIVDHLSEMNDPTRRIIRPGDASFFAYALVVTSRLDESLDGVTRTVLEPRRIEGNRLSSFMESYLTQTGKRDLFDDPEYFEACRKLSLLVAERDITVLLAKLYADQMVAVKEGTGDDSLPDNIPDLMLQYVKILNRERAEDDPDTAEVQAVAKVTAWECMRRTFRPGPALRKDILDALQEAGHAETHLDYLEHRLRIIRTTGVSDEKVLFELDPLAEYLAGLHLVDLYRDDREDWNQFLGDADTQPGAPETIKGFLLAVRDACLAKRDSVGGVFEFVTEQLAKRAGFDPEAIARAHLQQRIRRLIAQLSVPEPEDRIAAAEALRDIGPKAMPAVPALCQGLKDENSEVRECTAWALWKIEPDSKSVVPAFIEALKDDEFYVRLDIARALANIGPDAKSAVPALTQTLKDWSPDIRSSAAKALGRIGPDAKPAVPALIKAFQHETSAVRRYVAEALGSIRPEGVAALIQALTHDDDTVRPRAAYALGSIGPEAKAAVPGLTQALRDTDHDVRRSATVALGRIGPGAEDAVPALIEALKDEDDTVCWLAAAGLGSIGPVAKAVVPALIEALKHDVWKVRWHAAEALGTIGPQAETVVPALIDALKDHEEYVRWRAADALGKTGPSAKAAVPALTEALNDPKLREEAREALRKIRGESDNGT